MFRLCVLFFSVNIIYGDNVNLDLCGDHFPMCKNMKSLCCTSETNMLYVNDISIKTCLKNRLMFINTCSPGFLFLKAMTKAFTFNSRRHCII